MVEQHLKQFQNSFKRDLKEYVGFFRKYLKQCSCENLGAELSFLCLYFVIHLIPDYDLI